MSAGAAPENKVTQTSKSAVSRVSQPAWRRLARRVQHVRDLPIWKSAIQQVGKPAVRPARRQFDLLKTKHPELRARLPGGQSLAYLVLSLPGGQTGVDSSPLQMLSEFPALIVDDEVKARVMALRTQKNLPDEELCQLAVEFHYAEQGQVELRFNHLDFDLIGKLQVDELVDRQRTPRSKASILIVLGTLGRFASVK